MLFLYQCPSFQLLAITKENGIGKQVTSMLIINKSEKHVLEQGHLFPLCNFFFLLTSANSSDIPDCLFEIS